MGRVALKVKLLRFTPGPEELVAMGAKLCYSPAAIDELEDAVAESDQTAFIRKLTALGHLSPIEHASFTFGVEGVSRALLAQITRHRIASFSVQSQRYVQAGGELGFGYIVPPSIEALGPEAVQRFEEQMKTIQAWYDDWVAALGASGEKANQDARFVLPNAAETKFLVTMNARELLHFFRLRCCNRAQWEIHELADEMLRLAKKAAPGLFEYAGPGCVGGSCPEGKMTCGRMAEVRTKYREMI